MSILKAPPFQKNTRVSMQYRDTDCVTEMLLYHWAFDQRNSTNTVILGLPP